jgi:hypothetical protein
MLAAFFDTKDLKHEVTKTRSHKDAKARRFFNFSKELLNEKYFQLLVSNDSLKPFIPQSETEENSCRHRFGNRRQMQHSKNKRLINGKRFQPFEPFEHIELIEPLNPLKLNKPIVKVENLQPLPNLLSTLIYI